MVDFLEAKNELEKRKCTKILKISMGERLGQWIIDYVQMDVNEKGDTMNNFNSACPSGNTLVDGFHDTREPEFINNISELRHYLREHLPAFSKEEMKSIIRKFRDDGFYKIS